MFVVPEISERLGERPGELCSGGEPVGRGHGEGPVDRLLDGLRHARAQRPHVRQRLEHPLSDHGLRRASRVRDLAGEHLVQDAAEAVEVRPAIHTRRAVRLLWAHVGGRAHRHARGRQVLSVSDLQRPGDAEIRDQRVAPAEQDVLGLDVPVHDALAVRVAQRVGHLAGDLQRVVERQLTLAPQPIPEGLALDVGHRVPELASRFAGIEHGQDVRVLQAGGGPDFPLEALRAEGGGELGVQDLERDRAVVPEIVGQEHRGHATPPQLALEPVAVSQAALELFAEVCHASLS